MLKFVSAMLCILLSVSYADEPETLRPGTKAPDFNLMGVDGKMYSLSDFDDAQILTIIFTANHCPTAQAYEERMKQLSADYEDSEMQVVAVSSNSPAALCLEEIGYSDLGDTFEDMQKRAENAGYNFPYLYDGDEQAMAKAYGPKTTPHVFVLDENRVIRFQGRIDDTENPYKVPASRDTRNAIDALLAGEEVPVKETKVFGCSIKWASKKEWRDKLDADWAAKEVTLEKIDQAGVEAMAANPTEKYRLVNLWATWCGPCVIEFPELVNMQRMYGRRDFEMISISTDASAQEDKALEFLKEKQAAFTNYLYDSDDKYSLMEAIDTQWNGSLPHTVLIAPGGEILYRHNGIIDPLEVRRAIIKQIGRYFADD